MTRRLRLDTETYAQSQLCIHCGLCLPACPTYLVTGNEAESPRGRIHLIKAMADGRTDPSDRNQAPLDTCLNCRACETACPSGVIYHKLIEQTRQRTGRRPRGPIGWLIGNILPHPARLRPLIRLARWFGPLLRFLGPAGRAAAVAADHATVAPPVFGRHPAQGARQRSVGLLVGCAGSVFEAQLQRKTVGLLQRFGCEVIVPPVRCCGALAAHNADEAGARRAAEPLLDAFKHVDQVITTAAGCGAMLKDYPRLFAGTGHAEAAAGLAARTQDICEFLQTLNLPDPPHPLDREAIYHDACHLAHAQKITQPPRHLMDRIGVQLRPLAESAVCCGAAGTYSLLQPKMSGDLARRKVDAIVDSEADLCLSGNIGCTLQIKTEAARRGLNLQVLHPVDLLAEAYGVSGPAESAVQPAGPTR